VLSKKVLSSKTKNNISVKALAKSINNFFWYRRKVSEGTKGPIEYEFTKRRIVLSRQGLPHKTVWLLIRRTLEKEPQYSFYISNAPLSTKLDKFIWLSGLRWSIEQCFEETKTELGMDQYEGAKVHRLAAPYPDIDACALLPLAHESQIGKKKHLLLQPRSLD
jgi:hypothetical protein